CALLFYFFFFQAEDGIRDFHVTGVQTCALPILSRLGEPPLWSIPWRWNILHAAVLAEEPDLADEQAAALAAAADHSRYAAAIATAAESWLEVVRGVVVPERVEAAARGLPAIR